MDSGVRLHVEEDGARRAVGHIEVVVVGVESEVQGRRRVRISRYHILSVQ